MDGASATTEKVVIPRRTTELVPRNSRPSRPVILPTASMDSVLEFARAGGLHYTTGLTHDERGYR